MIDLTSIKEHTSHALKATAMVALASYYTALLSADRVQREYKMYAYTVATTHAATQSVYCNVSTVYILSVYTV